MIQVRYEYEKSKISYYTDNHEREDILLQWYACIKKRKELSFMKLLWVQVKCGTKDTEWIHMDRFNNVESRQYFGPMGGMIHPLFQQYTNEATFSCQY